MRQQKREDVEKKVKVFALRQVVVVEGLLSAANLCTLLWKGCMRAQPSRRLPSAVTDIKTSRFAGRLVLQVVEAAETFSVVVPGAISSSQD